MRMKLRAAAGSLLVSAAVAGAAVVPASGQAGEAGVQAVPGDVCHIRAGIIGVVWLNGVNYYTLNPGDGFRVLGYRDEYYVGHGNGQPDGYLLRTDIDQASCH